MSATKPEVNLVEYFQNWINSMHGLSKRLLDDNRFLASERIRRLFIMTTIQEQRAHVIQHFCRPQKNCQICSKIQEYKALVSKTKQDLKEVVENILHWQSIGIGLIESVDYFVQYLEASNFEEVEESSEEEEAQCITMEKLCVIEEKEKCSSQESNQCNRMKEGCAKELEKCNTEKWNIAENCVLHLEQHFPISSGRLVEMEVLQRMYYKIKYMFEKSREKHYHHICSVIDIIATFDQMSKVKNEILQLAKEMM